MVLVYYTSTRRTQFFICMYILYGRQWTLRANDAKFAVKWRSGDCFRMSTFYGELHVCRMIVGWQWEEERGGGGGEAFFIRTRMTVG